MRPPARAEGRLYGTAAAADDIEAVRAALGLERLDLWGSSYGTYLMTVYAARHPVHVQSLVLHGAYPIDFDPWALDRLAAARRSIGLVCARSAEIGVGPSMASGGHTWSGNCAVFPTAPMKSRRQIARDGRDVEAAPERSKEIVVAF